MSKMMLELLFFRKLFGIRLFHVVDHVLDEAKIINK